MVQETDDRFPKMHCHSRRKGETIFHLIWVNAIDVKWKLNLIITHPIALIIIGIKCAVSLQKSRKNKFDFETRFSDSYVQPSVYFFFWRCPLIIIFFRMLLNQELNSNLWSAYIITWCTHFEENSTVYQKRIGKEK